jgi:hypothetical protein
VEQAVLDAWAQSQQGELIAPYLTEIMGRRTNFVKGADHFKYVSQQIDGGPIYYVCDAVSEISTGNQLRNEFNIIPMGFANVIDRPQVMHAAKLVSEAIPTCASSSSIPFPIDELLVNEDLLSLPNNVQLEAELEAAGARHVATGSASEIVGDLRGYLANELWHQYTSDVLRTGRFGF